ncbi:ATP-binding cassette domain-containing protein [Moorellaceae bacterium AZ2]
MEIALKEVCFYYQTGGQDIPGLVDVSLTVPPGEWLAVIGAGGSGKSTLAQIMAGLLRPTRGQVYLDGVPLWRPRGKGKPAWRGRIGLALQQPEQQLFAETVREDVAFGPRSLGLPPEEVERRVRRSLRSVGLDQEVAGRSPFSLSGGQQRRAALAGILALEPEVLILDEPTAGLDPAGRTLILQVLQRYHRQGNTVIFISHNMAEVAALAQRIAVLHQGRLVFCGTPGEAFDEGADLARWGLRPPPLSELFLELRRLGAPVSPAVFSLEAAEEEILRWYRGEIHGL